MGHQVTTGANINITEQVFSLVAANEFTGRADLLPALPVIKCIKKYA
jgi:hypothetical protein